MIGVSVPTASYSEWQFRVDMWFNARMKYFVTVFRVVMYPLVEDKSTVQFERVVV